MPQLEHVVEAGAEGLHPGQPEDKHGIRASNTAAISFDDVGVGVEDLVGGTEGEGLTQAQAGERMCVSRGTVQRLAARGRLKVATVLTGGQACRGGAGGGGGDG